MRLYRLLLRLYPAAFRYEYGEELCRIFARDRRDAAGPLAVLMLWIGAVVDTATNAARVHVDILRQPIADIQPLAAIVDGETTARAVQVRVLGAFAALACLLAAVGLHGLLAFVVSARAREFGVRLALGAEPREILTLVARRGLVLGMAGVAVGVVVAYLAGRWMESLLVGVSPADAPTLAIAISVSVGMTLAESLLPAIRAARTSPTDAMRVE